MWVLYLAVGTTGLVMLVPTLLQALDGQQNGRWWSFAAFAATGAGAIGLIAPRFTSSTGLGLLASLAIGCALGAMGTEVLAALRNRRRVPSLRT